ncbi:MAG: thioredoxin family protein [Bradymonadales bacterium]|nr:MAG: thioredoxin family protein [Bradymonadales bacterium]
MATQSQEIQLMTDLPNFELQGVDGKTYRLEDFDSSKVLVVGITCNHCPYVQAYEERISALASKYKEAPVSVLCVNSNDAVAYPDDAFDRMKERAKEKAFSFLYLRDETQSFAKSIGAACTPEFFVYDSTRKLRYHGRLDDQQDPKLVKRHYLDEVISSLLEGQDPPFSQTSAIGCSIKWKN